MWNEGRKAAQSEIFGHSEELFITSSNVKKKFLTEILKSWSVHVSTFSQL